MRLERAASIGAIPINFNETDAVQSILSHEPNGVTRAVDCVGMEAVNAQGELDEGVILRNMVQVVGQYGGIGQIGVYMAQASNSVGAPLAETIPQSISFAISDFFQKHLRYEAGVVDPKILAPKLVELISAGRARPGFISSAEIRLDEVPWYYQRFDRKEEIKCISIFLDLGL